MFLNKKKFLSNRSHQLHLQLMYVRGNIHLIPWSEHLEILLQAEDCTSVYEKTISYQVLPFTPLTHETSICSNLKDNQISQIFFVV